MPAFIAAALRFLIGLVVRYLPGILVNVLLFFGIQMATNKYALPALEHTILVALGSGGAPSMVLQALAAVQFDKAVSIILSAYITAAASRLIFRRAPVPVAP